MKCPHCGSWRVAYSEKAWANFIRAITYSNKHFCFECKGKWKTRVKNQDVLARELLAICFVGLLGFAIIKAFYSQEPGSQTRNRAGEAGGGGIENLVATELMQNAEGKANSNFSSGNFRNVTNLKQGNLSALVKGGGFGGVVTQFLSQYRGQKLSASRKRQLREQHKDVINKLSPSQKQQIKDMMKQMHIE